MAKKKAVFKTQTCSEGKVCGLNAPKFALTLGIMCGLIMLILGAAATYANYGVELVKLMSSIYPGYDTTLVGAIIGLLWGVIEGLLFGFIFARVYNKLI